MVSKGRVARGEQTSTSVLTDKDIKPIREEYATGNISQRQLAKKYGVCQATIKDVLARITWTHII